MSNDPRWLTVAEIIEINREVAASNGESFSILSWPLLESAQARPITSFHYGVTDIVELACVICIGLVRNHCFQNGNKRVGFVAMREFLRLNGYQLMAPAVDDDGAFGEALIDVVKHTLSEEAFADMVDEHVSELPSGTSTKNE